MSVRKYLFWISCQGIRTYKIPKKGSYELVKYKGEDKYPETDLCDFFMWFEKAASITSDEYIDYCFLSDHYIDSLEYTHMPSLISSWNTDDIEAFCGNTAGLDNCFVYYTNNDYFVCQHRNVSDKESVRKLYIKCVPDFSINAPQKCDEGSDKTSILNKYFTIVRREQCEIT